MLRKILKRLFKKIMLVQLFFTFFMIITITAVSGSCSQTKINGSLSTIEGIPVLTVWGTPREQGFAYGYLIGELFIKTFNSFLKENRLGIDKERYEKAFIPGLNRMEIEPAFEEELNAMFDGIKAASGNHIFISFLGRDLRVTDLVAINCMNDIIRMSCSSVSVWGNMTQNGSPITGRNNDWHKIAAMIENQLVVVRIPPEGSGKLGFVSVAWPGIIGCITGMNEKGIVLTSHDSRGLPPSVRNGIYPYMLTFRRIIESTSPSTAIQDVEEILNSRVTGIGKNLMITIPTGSEGPRAVVFELDGNREKGNGFTKRFPDETYSYMICTNHFRERRVPDGDFWRFELLSNRLEKIDRNKSEKHITIDHVWDLLGEVVLPGWRTHHSVVFEPDKMIMHVAIAETEKDAPFCKRVQFNLSELLGVND